MQKIPIYLKDGKIHNVYDLEKKVRERASEKNELQIMSLFGRAGLIVKDYKIDTAQVIDDLNYSIYFRKKTKFVKKLKVINGQCWDLDYNDTGKKKQVDMYNSGWFLAFIMEQEDHGVPVRGWMTMSKSCKIRPFVKVEKDDYGTEQIKFFYYCKTKENGKWKWTGSRVEVKKRKPSERKKLARFLFSKKGVEVKAIAVMLGLVNKHGKIIVRTAQTYVQNLRKAKCKCDIKIKLPSMRY
jgi:hypothetical protein